MSDHQSWDPRAHTSAKVMGQGGWEPPHAPGRIDPPRRDHATAAIFGYAIVCTVVLAAILVILLLGGGAL